MMSQRDVKIHTAVDKAELRVNDSQVGYDMGRGQLQRLLVKSGCFSQKVSELLSRRVRIVGVQESPVRD